MVQNIIIQHLKGEGIYEELTIKQVEDLLKRCDSEDAENLKEEFQEATSEVNKVTAYGKNIIKARSIFTKQRDLHRLVFMNKFPCSFVLRINIATRSYYLVK